MMVYGLPTLAKHFHPTQFEDVDAESYLDNFYSDIFDVDRVGTFTCSS